LFLLVFISHHWEHKYCQHGNRGYQRQNFRAGEYSIPFYLHTSYVQLCLEDYTSKAALTPVITDIFIFAWERFPQAASFGLRALPRRFLSPSDYD